MNVDLAATVVNDVSRDDPIPDRPEARLRMGAEDRALLDLLRLLRARRYQFITPTPATHARVAARRNREKARSVRDVLGWSLPFRRGEIDLQVERLLQEADVLASDGELCRSRVRVSTLQDEFFLHSASPTNEPDAVFFGPDSYRFAALLEAELKRRPSRACARIVDMGTGTGVGAVIGARLCPGARVRMTDINPLALRFARINAVAAGVSAEAHECSSIDGLDGEFDLIMANPPYIIDPDSRLYRDGGGMHGAQVSLDMARMALDRLAPDGRMILYTGSAIVEGEDALRDALRREAAARGLDLRYRELDPDVFGEELENAGYRDVERIAVVAAVIHRPPPE